VGGRLGADIVVGDAEATHQLVEGRVLHSRDLSSLHLHPLGLSQRANHKHAAYVVDDVVERLTRMTEVELDRVGTVAAFEAQPNAL